MMTMTVLLTFELFGILAAIGLLLKAIMYFTKTLTIDKTIKHHKVYRPNLWNK